MWIDLFKQNIFLTIQMSLKQNIAHSKITMNSKAYSQEHNSNNKKKKHKQNKNKYDVASGKYTNRKSIFDQQFDIDEITAKTQSKYGTFHPKNICDQYQQHQQLKNIQATQYNNGLQEQSDCIVESQQSQLYQQKYDSNSENNSEYLKNNQNQVQNTYPHTRITTKNSNHCMKKSPLQTLNSKIMQNPYIKHHNNHSKLISKSQLYSHQTKKQSIQQLIRQLQEREMNKQQISYDPPQSYLLAMQKMQNTIKQLEEDMENMHEKLVNQEKDKLIYEEKINKILKDYQVLQREKQLTLIQNKALKDQLWRVRDQKSLNNKSHKNYLDSYNNKNIQSKQQIYPLKQQSISNSNYLGSLQSCMPDKQSFFEQPSKQIQIMKSYNNQHILSQRDNNIPYPTFNSEQPSRFIKNNQKNLNDSKKKDQYYAINSKSLKQTDQNWRKKEELQHYKQQNYIKQYRNLIRAQKQMVSLKYRQECLLRKIGNQKSKQNQDTLKKKLQKVVKEIKQLNLAIEDFKFQQKKSLKNV